MSAPESRPLAVALLGGGVMASAIAPHLRTRGHRLRWFNRTAARIAPHLRTGDVLCASAREAAQGADVVLSLISDDEAAAAVWDGEQGALRSVRSGAVAVECSTLSTARIDAWAKACQAAGAGPVDCPLTGGRSRAIQGTLIALAGGRSEDLRRVAPVVGSFTERVVHFGPVGSGARYKLVHNAAAAICLTAVAEALALARASGLDLPLAADTLASHGWASLPAQYAAAAMLGGEFTEITCSAANLAKDLRYAHAAADIAGVDLPLTAAAVERFSAVVGGEHLDMAAVAQNYPLTTISTMEESR